MEIPEYTLSFQQQLYWKHYRRYRLATAALEIYGGLDQGRLRDTFTELVLQHETLRTQLFQRGADVLQAVLSYDQNQFTVDYMGRKSKLSVDSLIEGIGRDLSGAAGRPDAGFQFSVRLIRLDRHRHILIWAIDHTLIDGISLRRLFREMWGRYGGTINSKIVSRPRYSEYVNWQRGWHADWLRTHQPYWQSNLTGAAIPQLPPVAGSTHSNADSTFGCTISFELRATESLRGAARQLRSMTSLIGLAAFASAIFRWCHQEDFIIACLTSVRGHRDHLFTLGYFVQPLFIRVRLRGCDSLSEVLRRIASEVGSGYLHQDFGAVALEAPALLSGARFEWVSWELAEEWGYLPQLPGKATDLKVKLFPSRTHASSPTKLSNYFLPAAVGATFYEHGETISGSIYASAEHFTGESLGRFCSNVRSVLSAFIEDPHQRLQAL